MTISSAFIPIITAVLFSLLFLSFYDSDLTLIWDRPSSQDLNVYNQGPELYI